MKNQTKWAYKFYKEKYNDRYTCSIEVKMPDGKMKTCSISATRSLTEKPDGSYGVETRTELKNRLLRHLIESYVVKADGTILLGKN